jgi:hypothetical protein
VTYINNIKLRKIKEKIQVNGLPENQNHQFIMVAKRKENCFSNTSKLAYPYGL